MASPIVKRVLDRHEGEKSLRILESNFTPNNAKLWDIAKTLAEKKFDVYSTEAHGWAYKWYEKKGGIFKELNEATRVPSEMGNVYRVLYSWRGKTFMMKMFFPTPKKPTRKQVEIALDKVYPSAMVRNYYESEIDYSDPYIHVGKGDGIT